ncbi:MAG: MFS transporter, partial [Actinomycetota bacterium]
MTHGHRLLETREVIGLGLVATLVPLNSTMIIVALGDIGDDLDVSKGTASWLVTLYLGVMLIGQPLAGRMADRVGSGRLLTTSLAGFVAMSVVAALAPNFAFLFVARMVHAALGAAFVPVVETLLRMLSPERDRGRNFGILGSFFGVGTVAGPIVGGGVTELVGWQGIFLANIPVILVSLVLIRDVLRVAGARERGSGTSDLARVGLGSAFQWAFTTQSTTVFGQYCLLLIVPIVLDARGWSAGEVGLALTAMTVGMLGLGPVGGRLGDRGGRRL